MANRGKLLGIGESFEFKLMSIVRSTFPDAIILHDLRLHSAYLGKTTQIDILVITGIGVFCIEAKNWKHWIKGNYDDFNWSGLTNERKTMKVFNTYHQNFIHIRALRNAMRVSGFEPVQFVNAIVVPDGTEIRSDCKEVINLSKLPRFMQEHGVEHIDKFEYRDAVRGVTS